MMTTVTDAPRIAPLAPEGRDARTEELVRSLRFDPEADDMNLFATLAHHPRLLKRWSAFGGMLLALSLIHISEPTRLLSISYAVFCLKKKKS